MVILIPAYNPDDRLTQLTADIRGICDYSIVVVDDGSDPMCAPVFSAAEALGATVLHSDRNYGKGHALKTGFSYINTIGETQGIVCADCDGQHKPADILAVAKAIDPDDEDIVLGTRQFKRGVPLKSHIWNRLSCITFFLATGQLVPDTQTGLRGYPPELLPWLLEIEGERFDYELNVLLGAIGAEYDIIQIHIDTIYHEKNRDSHFRPMIDSARFVRPLASFGSGSLAASIIDFIALILIEYFTGNLIFSIIIARICSSTTKISANRKIVFDKFPSKSRLRSAIRYFSVLALLLLANILLMLVFKHLFGLYLVPAKLLTELILLAATFFAQKIVIRLRNRNASTGTIK